jgi:hypothetical protein
LKDEYIKKYKRHWLEYLELTPKTKKAKLDSKAMKLLLRHYPEDQVLQLAYDISKRNRAIEQIGRLLKYADGLYPNYNLLACSTGRFRVDKPDLALPPCANMHYRGCPALLGYNMPPEGGSDKDQGI